MKKIFGYVVILGIFILILQFVINITKTNHIVEYTLKDNTFKVNEEYIKSGDVNYYLFQTNWNGMTFVFDVDNHFNKQKNVIKDFEVYTNNNVSCISPIYISGDIESKIYCNDGDRQVSYTSVKARYNFDDFINQLSNYDDSLYENDAITKEVDKTTYYPNNIKNNENIVLYNYKNILVIDNKQATALSFSNYDIYQNNLGRLVEDIYIIPNFEEKLEYSSFNTINVVTRERDILLFDESISSNIYINGIVDDLIYITDKSNYKQYEINPAKLSYREIGNKEDGGQFFDGIEWTTVKMNELVNKKLLFTNKNNDIKYEYTDYFEDEKAYYYYNSDMEFYKLYKRKLDEPIYLFTSKYAKEVTSDKGNLYYIVGSNLYRYDEYGQKSILKNNELRYNYENIYGAYNK